VYGSVRLVLDYVWRASFKEFQVIFYPTSQTSRTLASKKSNYRPVSLKNLKFLKDASKTLF
jgi:hypothetical protein